MRYGLRKGVKRLVIYGDAEAAQGGVQVKDLAARQQEFVMADDLVEYLQSRKRTAE
jgi:histidyl-tRNA synthetase